MTQIREMKLEELDQVIQLYFEGLQRELMLQSDLLPGKTANAKGLGALTKILLDLMRNRDGQIFVADQDGGLLGYCLVTKKHYPAETPQMCGCINGIYLVESSRQKGLGQKLLQAAFVWLKSEQIRYVELYHVTNDDVARHFWEKNGFVPVQTTRAKWI